MLLSARFSKHVAVSETAILQCAVEYEVAQPIPAFGAVGSSVGLQQRGRAADRAL
jgi:hypothetical protein